MVATTGSHSPYSEIKYIKHKINLSDFSLSIIDSWTNLWKNIITKPTVTIKYSCTTWSCKYLHIEVMLRQDMYVSRCYQDKAKENTYRELYKFYWELWWNILPCKCQVDRHVSKPLKAAKQWDYTNELQLKEKGSFFQVCLVLTRTFHWPYLNSGVQTQLTKLYISRGLKSYRFKR